MTIAEVVKFAKDVAVEGLAGVVLALLAIFWRQLVWILTGLMPDIPKIRGTWTTTFTEPQEDGTRGEVKEKATLRQYGRYIRGKIESATGAATWKISGHLVASSFFCSFTNTRNPGAPGSGSFLLCVDGTTNKMTGWVIWHDLDTNKAEGCEYLWKRIQ